MSERKILKDFDQDGNGWLDAAERRAARAELQRSGAGRRGPRGGFGPRPGMEGKPGPAIALTEAAVYPDRPLYDPAILRTIFLQFEHEDWEQELEDFHGTDVDVPCTMIVDGKTYQHVGVHFRGTSSYLGVPAGLKRSLNLALDLVEKNQRLGGYKTLNLLNCHGDDSMLSTVLYSHIANQYMPAPKANMVRVVINGESWGIYCNVQQFDKVFLQEHFGKSEGTRWKVHGSPQARGGLEYFGERIEDYKRAFEIKGKDDEQAWKALINLCRVLHETPVDQLEAAIRPLMDLENVLWFLALDCVLCNSDGYWIRASDYSIHRDASGLFRFFPHDMNEAFRGGPGGPFGPGGPGGGMMMFGGPRPVIGEILPAPVRDALRLSREQQQQIDALQKKVDEQLAKILTDEQRRQLNDMKQAPPMGFGGPGGMEPGPGGPPPGGGFPGGAQGNPRGGGRGEPPGGRGGMGRPGGFPGGGPRLDPLIGLNDERKPLRSKLLQVPALRENYLAKVRTIAEQSLNWDQLGPVVAQYRQLLEEEIRKDTRKLTTVEAFLRATAGEPIDGRGPNLRAFVEQRRAYLLETTKSRSNR